MDGRWMVDGYRSDNKEDELVELNMGFSRIDGFVFRQDENSLVFVPRHFASVRFKEHCANCRNRKVDFDDEVE